MLDQVAAGLVARDRDALTLYADRSPRASHEPGGASHKSSAWTQDHLSVLREMTVRDTARAVGVDPSTITRIRSGSIAIPHERHRRALTHEVARHARTRLREGAVDVALDDASAIKVYMWFKRMLSKRPDRE